MRNESNLARRKKRRRRRKKLFKASRVIINICQGLENALERRLHDRLLKVLRTNANLFRVLVRRFSQEKSSFSRVRARSTGHRNMINRAFTPSSIASALCLDNDDDIGDLYLSLVIFEQRNFLLSPSR